jgi:class 3 adenylate cyclase
MPNTVRLTSLTDQLPVSWTKVRGTILFADIKGFFPISERLSLDDLGKLIAHLYGFWGEEIRRQRGEVVNHVYDSVLGLFRQGGCGGKDPEWCATAAAFHITRGISQIRSDFSLNVGVLSGEFLEGVWQEQGRPMHTLLGTLVNRAAMMVNSKAGGIFATKNVVEVLGPRVKSERCTIKGIGGESEETIFRLTSLVL